MANSIQNRRNQQSYLRQVQQEKSAQKRELMKAQQEDIKSIRSYYADQTKQLDTDTAAAINHINEEARQKAAEEQQKRSENAQQKAEQKRLEREELHASNRLQDTDKDA